MLTLKIGWMRSQAKECQLPPEAGRSKKQILPHSLQKEGHPNTLMFIP